MPGYLNSLRQAVVSRGSSIGFYTSRLPVYATLLRVSSASSGLVAMLIQTQRNTKHRQPNILNANQCYVRNAGRDCSVMMVGMWDEMSRLRGVASCLRTCETGR